MRKATRHNAFTLIEVLVVSMMIGILAMSMAVTFSGSKQSAQHRSTQDEVFNLIQKARGLSFSSVYVNGVEPLDYYVLQFDAQEVQLNAIGGSETEPIDSIELPEELMFTIGETYREVNEMALYYFPPYGTLCFVENEADCDEIPSWLMDYGYEGYIGIPLSAQDEEDDFEVTFEITKHGAFVEIAE